LIVFATWVACFCNMGGELIVTAKSATFEVR
jgi:hypothetical protein